MTYNTIVDRYMSLTNRDAFTPASVEQHVVDALSDVTLLPDESPKDTLYKLTRHPATMSFV